MSERRYNRGADGTNPADDSFQHRPDGVREELGGDELQRLYGIWTDGIPLHDDGEFWAGIEDTLRNCDELMQSEGWIRKDNRADFPSHRNSEPFSSLWYAGQIGFICWFLLNVHRKNEPNTVLISDAIRLGRMLEQYEWRNAHKPSITRGRSVRKGAKTGGDMRRNKLEPDTKMRLYEMRRLIEKGHSQSSAADALARQGIGISKSANLKIWQRHADKT